jgi:ArsR family transcriptional regulator
MEPDQFQRISKALADPRRLEILERIASRKEAACSAICEEFPVSQATISHHLKELANAGLIRVRRQAKFVFYELERKVWSDYLAEMRRRIPSARPRGKL